MSTDAEILKKIDNLLLWQDEYSSEITEIAKLSPRERRVAYLLARGNSNKMVAAILAVGIKTAEKHRANAMKKLKVSSFAELVRVITVAQILGEFPVVEPK
jgi:FixJ family two-component response regulator